MAEYYVDNAGADGTGTFANPWNNVAGHVNDLSAGDTMYIRGDAAPGRVYTESPIAPTVSGTSGNPITIKPYTGEFVIIKTTPVAYNFTFRLDGNSWWTLDGLKFDRDYVGGIQINIDGSSHLRIRNCELSQNGGDAAIQFSLDNTGDDVIIDNCTIHDTFKNNTSDSTGISIGGGTNITISNCTIYDCRGDCLGADDAGSATIDNIIIEDNHLYTTLANCSENAIDLKKGTSVIIRRNVMHGFRYCDSTCGGSGGGIGEAITIHSEVGNALIEDNIIYDCVSGISNHKNITVRRNLFYDLVTDPGAWTNAAIYTWSTNDTIIYNNTFVNIPHRVLKFGDYVNVTLENNLFYDTNKIEISGSVGSVTYDYNGWFDCIDTLVGAHDTTGSGDPGFVDAANDNYTLLSISVCIDAGVNVGLDYYGDAPDLGYWEYEPSTPPIPPPVTVTIIRAISPIYKLRFYSPAGVLVAETADIWQLSYTRRVNYPGLATFNMSGNHPAVSLLENRSQVEVWRRNQRYGIDWYADFYGLYLSQEQQYTDRNIFTAYCPGLLWLLSTRIIAWYAATANRTTFTAVPAETIMKTLVQYNAAGSATTGNGRLRTGWIPGLGYDPDDAQGNVLSWNCAYKNLLTELQDLALVGGGDFDLLKVGAGYQNFRWYTGQRGTDRSATVVFSLDRGNMSNPHYRYGRISEKTVGIVGGSGEESNRDIVIRAGADFHNVSNNIEVFVDAGNLSTTAGQEAAGDKRLDELRARDAFSFGVEQTAACLYGSDYELGDLVTAQAFGVDGTYKIVAATVTLNEDGSDQVDIETEVQ